MRRRTLLPISLAMARLGIWLLARSGLYRSHFARWRSLLFDRAQAAGLHILPVHYYSPIPDLRKIPPDDGRPKFHGATDDVLDAAVERLEGFAARYGAAFAEIADRPPFGHGETVTGFRFGAAPYSTLEAETLYALVRTGRPKRIVEVGCGHTTLLIAEAIRAEAASGYSPDYTCIEPFRPAYLEAPPPEVTRFEETPVQDVPLDRFWALEAGDILFIDSSHVVAYGSDTVHELTAILPGLQPGVLVHFHDIFLPYEYPPEWLRASRFFWTEQYMLAAALRDNPRYRILLPLHQLSRERRDRLLPLFPLLNSPRHRPSAYWLEIAAPARTRPGPGARSRIA